jgi:hypothetical protein
MGLQLPQNQSLVCEVNSSQRKLGFGAFFQSFIQFLRKHDQQLKHCYLFVKFTLALTTAAALSVWVELQVMGNIHLVLFS